MAELNVESDPGTFQPSWILTANDAGQAVRVAPYSDKSYAIWGEFGGTVRLEGSWDKSTPAGGDSWFTLYESDNTTAISVSARASGVVLENPIWIRPKALASVALVRIALNCTKSGR